MYTVLLPVGSDPEQAEWSAKLVAELDVTVLNVFREFDVADSGGRVDSDDFLDDIEPLESVELAEEYLEGEGIQTATRLEHSDVEDLIVEIAEEIGANMIVMEGRKRSPVGKAIFGSTTQDVLLNSSIPVSVALS